MNTVAELAKANAQEIFVLESAKNNYLLTFHYQSRAQEKMKNLIEFKPD